MGIDRSRRWSVHIAWFALALAGGVRAQLPGGAGFDSSNQVYRCTGGARLPVVYLNIKGGESFATAFVNGHLVLMRSGPTGSGANYAAVEGQAGYRWHVKGDQGNLFYVGAEPGARETLLLQDCKAQRLP